MNNTRACTVLYQIALRCLVATVGVLKQQQLNIDVDG